MFLVFLGILFMMFVVMSRLAIEGTMLLFLIKKNNTNDVLLVVMTAYSMSIAYMTAVVNPFNLVGIQVWAWGVGLIAVAGTGIRFLTKKQLLISKILVSGSVIAGVYLLYFGKPHIFSLSISWVWWVLCNLGY